MCSAGYAAGDRHMHHASYPEQGNSSREFPAQSSGPYQPAGHDGLANGHFPAAAWQQRQHTPSPPPYRPSTAETLRYRDSRHGTSSHGDGSAARREAHAGMQHERAAQPQQQQQQQQRYASRPGSGQGAPAGAPPECLDGKEFFRRHVLCPLHADACSSSTDACRHSMCLHSCLHAKLLPAVSAMPLLCQHPVFLMSSGTPELHHRGHQGACACIACAGRAHG